MNNRQIINELRIENNIDIDILEYEEWEKELNKKQDVNNKKVFKKNKNRKI